MADMGPLYATFDPSDAEHERAQGDIERLNLEGLRVTVTHSTLCEAYSLILYKLGIARAHSWLREVQGYTALLNPSPEDYRQAAERVLGYGDQELSIFDAVAAVVSERLSVPVWTYDHHFDVMRVEVWRNG